MSRAGGDSGPHQSRLEESDWPRLVVEAVDWPRVVLVALSLAVAVALFVAATTSSGAFDPYNPSWEGTSDLRTAVEDDPQVSSELVGDSSRYVEVEPAGTVAFVVPDDHGDEDTDRIGTFVREGGTLVVLENFGDEGNELLATVGAEARTDGLVIRDEHHYYRSPTIPVATDVENDSLTAGVEQVTLNHATAVEPGNATVLVSTSEFAYLVADPDDGFDEAEVGVGSYPVATIEEVGDGQVIVVGDPSVTINAMREHPDNAAFLENLYADESRVLFDLPGADDVPPLVAALLTVRKTPLLQTLLGAIVVAGLAAVGTRRDGPGLERVRARLPSALSGRERLVGESRSALTKVTGPGLTEKSGPGLTEESDPGLTEAERAAVLRQRHPDWEEERIERVLTAIDRLDGGAATERGASDG